MPEQWHYVITLTWRTGVRGVETFTVDGLLEQAGDSRMEAFQAILRYARELKGIPESSDSYVGFFSLEPNRLPS
ncbi:hypothetical protein [Nocardia otitidiscaviarum]|uniref:hypothetical protein n=1 Tax=Nocardia otitidiscaviarum TaxID=1823 RepID=UPI0004A71043|nr:hypothetical protein [Nocardia otitidiscaviarum]